MSAGNWGGPWLGGDKTSLLQRLNMVSGPYRPPTSSNPFLDYMQRSGFLERLFGGNYRQPPYSPRFGPLVANDWGFNNPNPISVDDLRNLPSPTPEQMRPISRNGSLGYPNQTPVPATPSHMTDNVQAYREYMDRIRAARAAAAAPVAPPPTFQTHPFGPNGLGWSPQQPTP